MPSTLVPPRRSASRPPPIPPGYDTPWLPPIPTAPKLTPVSPLDLVLLHDLPSLELRARFVMDGFLAGLHRSPRKGSSVEFAEYRTYQLGDDLRRIDWRLYGRTDRLNIKQTEHETQLRLVLVLDSSASMAYTSRPGTHLPKIDFARTILAALGLLALRQGDAFGLAIMDSGLADYLKPKASQSHWRTALAKLDSMQTGGNTGLVGGLESLAEVLPARSLIVMASDFYVDMDRFRQVLRRLRFDHHEVLALQVLDPVEIEFHDDSSGTFVDAEDGHKLILDATAVRAGYLERFGAFLQQVSGTVREEGGDNALVRTDSSPTAALGLYLAERERLL